MRTPGERIKRTRLIQTEKYVVAVEVEMVIPADDPSEPCYESETVQLLREIKFHAEQGDVSWLAEKGKVYAVVEVACLQDHISDGWHGVPPDRWSSRGKCFHFSAA